MPLPIFLGIGAAVAGATGIGAGLKGAKKMKNANDTVKLAQERHESNISSLESQSKITTFSMDNLGKKELEILKSFSEFSDIFEKIKGKPEFKSYDKNGVNIPKYDPEKLSQVSIGAEVLLGGIGGAAAGTAGGFAAAGATTASIMALGTASTGTAIGTLSGIAATNATLAAIGGGSLAAGGGGIALGTTILGAATLGIGLLVGGVIFNFTGSSIANKSDNVWEEMLNAEKTINKIFSHLLQLERISRKYYESIYAVNEKYLSNLTILKYIVLTNNKTVWSEFTNEEKVLTENTALLVNLLYNMAKVQLVLASENDTDTNTINEKDITNSISNANSILESLGF